VVEISPLFSGKMAQTEKLFKIARVKKFLATPLYFVVCAYPRDPPRWGPDPLDKFFIWKFSEVSRTSDENMTIRKKKYLDPLKRFLGTCFVVFLVSFNFESPTKILL